MSDSGQIAGGGAWGDPRGAGAAKVPSDMRIYIAGPVFLDVVMSGLAHAPVPGEEQWVPHCDLMPGGSANQAVACARLGLPASLIAFLGMDGAGGLVRSRLLDEGVSLAFSTDIPRQSVTTSLFFDGDRAMTTFGTDAVPGLAGLEAPAALLADLRALADNRGAVRSWRAGGRGGTGVPTWVLADAGWDDSQRWDPMDLEALDAADVFAPNDVEARRYTRRDDAQSAARALAELVPGVVVTCGPRGVTAILDGQEIRLPAMPARVVDTTGAGDTFSAGLAWAHAHGLGPRAALSAASLAAACTVESPGGSASAPTAERLAQWTNLRRDDIPKEYDIQFLDLIERKRP